MSCDVNYRQVGSVERFDERDTVFSREGLDPESAEGVAYYSRHPDKKESDEDFRRYILKKLNPSTAAPDLSGAIYDAHFTTASALGLPDMVEGEPAPNPVKWDESVASHRVKEFALSIGADEVGIGPLRSEWVYSHRGTRPFFGESYRNLPYFRGTPSGYQGALHGDPIELHHPNAISLAFGQDLERMATGATLATDHEVGRRYLDACNASVQLARYIRGLGYRARAHHLRNSCVILVPVAADGGLGEMGRNGFLVSRKFGTNFRLACVTTDMPLAFDPPARLGMEDFCSKCMKCADNCPSGAISTKAPEVHNGVVKWKMDAESCLRFWGKAGHTCGFCQSVCPWSKPPRRFHKMCASMAVSFPILRRFMVWADDIFYGRKPARSPLPDWLE